MKKQLCIVSLSVFLTSCSSSNEAGRPSLGLVQIEIDWDEYGRGSWTSDLPLGDSNTAPASIEVSHSGHGTMVIPGARIHVYDDHDEGRKYDQNLLDVILVDINNDGFNDLIFSGVALIDETEKGEVHTAHEAIFAIYQYLPENKAFECKLDRGGVDCLAHSRIHRAMRICVENECAIHHADHGSNPSQGAE